MQISFEATWKVGEKKRKWKVETNKNSNILLSDYALAIKKLDGKWVGRETT